MLGGHFCCKYRHETKDKKVAGLILCCSNTLKCSFPAFLQHDTTIYRDGKIVGGMLLSPVFALAIFYIFRGCYRKRAKSLDVSQASSERATDLNVQRRFLNAWGMNIRKQHVNHRVAGGFDL